MLDVNSRLHTNLGKVPLDTHSVREQSGKEGMGNRGGGGGVNNVDLALIHVKL